MLCQVISKKKKKKTLSNSPHQIQVPMMNILSFCFGGEANSTHSLVLGSSPFTKLLNQSILPHSLIHISLSLFTAVATISYIIVRPILGTVLLNSLNGCFSSPQASMQRLLSNSFSLLFSPTPLHKC